MIVTWLDVVDSAVKIGLGAAIGGFSTYFTTKASHRHEIHRDRITRRRELLEKTALAFEEQAPVVAKLVDLYTLQPPAPVDPVVKQQIRDYVSEANNHLLRAFQFAALVGYPELSNALLEYQLVWLNFGKIANAGAKKDFPVEMHETIEEQVQLITNRRLAVSAALWRAHESIETAGGFLNSGGLARRGSTQEKEKEKSGTGDCHGIDASERANAFS